MKLLCEITMEEKMMHKNNNAYLLDLDFLGT